MVAPPDTDSAGTRPAPATAAPADRTPEEPPILPWKRVLLTVTAISTTLGIISFLMPVLLDTPLTRGRGELRVYIWVHEESNLPTWWSVSLLVCAALSFGVLGLLNRMLRAGGRAGPWWLLGAICALLALDELTFLHERLDRVGIALAGEGFALPWALIGAPIAVLLGIAVTVAVRRLPRTTARLTVAGIVVLLSAAVGLELVGGLMLGDQAGIHEGADLPYTFVYHLEEVGEMFGAGLLLCAPLAALGLRARNGGFVLGVRPGWAWKDRTDHPGSTSSTIGSRPTPA